MPNLVSKNRQKVCFQRHYILVEDTNILKITEINLFIAVINTTKERYLDHESLLRFDLIKEAREYFFVKGMADVG